LILMCNHLFWWSRGVRVQWIRLKQHFVVFTAQEALMPA
jgi:hypothetical protein